MANREWNLPGPGDVGVVPVDSAWNEQAVFAGNTTTNPPPPTKSAGGELVGAIAPERAAHVPGGQQVLPFDLQVPTDGRETITVGGIEYRRVDAGESASEAAGDGLLPRDLRVGGALYRSVARPRE